MVQVMESEVEQEDRVEAQELEQEEAQQARVELLAHSPPKSRLLRSLCSPRRI